MARLSDQRATTPGASVLGIALVVSGLLCNQWLVGILFTRDGVLSGASNLTMLWAVQSVLVAAGLSVLWLKPAPSFVWSVCRLPLLILWIFVVLEVSTRAFNRVYALERPEQLKDVDSRLWLEGGDWFNGETRLYIYKPDSRGTTYGHPIRVNHWGFRGPDFLPRGDAPDGVFRVAVIGDSTTMGQGVAESARYSDILAADLHAAYRYLSIEIVNLGIAGHETVQEERILRRMWPVVRPDLVILGFSVNDPNLHYRYQQPYTIPVPQALGKRLRSLMAFRQAESLYDPVYRLLSRTPTGMDEIWQAYSPESRDWQLFEGAVTSIGRFVHERLHRAPIVICLHEADQLKQLGFYQPVVDTFEKNGFDWVEIPKGRVQGVSRFEEHSNEATHAEYAKALFQEITRLHLIEEFDPIDASGHGDSTRR